MIAFLASSKIIFCFASGDPFGVGVDHCPMVVAGDEGRLLCLDDGAEGTSLTVGDFVGVTVGGEERGITLDAGGKGGFVAELNLRSNSFDAVKLAISVSTSSSSICEFILDGEVGILMKSFQLPTSPSPHNMES